MFSGQSRWGHRSYSNYKKVKYIKYLYMYHNLPYVLRYVNGVSKHAPRKTFPMAANFFYKTDTAEGEYGQPQLLGILSDINTFISPSHSMN